MGQLKKLGSQIQIGDVVNVNGDRFEVIDIQSIHPPIHADSRKVWFVSQSSGRKFVRLLWDNDSLDVSV
jgi:hypothetical protein